LRKLISATLGLAFLAAFSLANNANAATILTYGQIAAGIEVVNLQVQGTQTLLRSGPSGAASPISVRVDSNGGNPAGFPALETINLVSTNVASPGATSLGGFSGTITYVDPGTGNSVLNVAISNGVFTLQGAGAGSLLADAMFTGYPAGGAIATQVGGPPTTGAASLSFNNITSGGLAGFTAQNSGGGFNTGIIPEPASLVSGGIGLLAGVVLFGAQRRRAAKA